MTETSSAVLQIASVQLAPRSKARRERGFGEKCFVVKYHGQNRATFECAAVGHRFTARMFPPAPNGKFPAEALLEKFAHYWSRHHAEGKAGGCYMACPKCRSVNHD